MESDNDFINHILIFVVIMQQMTFIDYYVVQSLLYQQDHDQSVNLLMHHKNLMNHLHVINQDIKNMMYVNYDMVLLTF